MTNDQYGRFVLRGIRSGEYKLFALEDSAAGYLSACGHWACL
jgi:hypothetical protein